MTPVHTFIRAKARLHQRLVAYIILLGAGLGLLYFLLYFALNSSLSSTVFQTLANDQFRGSIQWKRIAWGPAPGHIRILEPVLKDQYGRTIITARSVIVSDFRLLSLLGGVIAADGIEIDAPIVRIVGQVKEKKYGPHVEQTTVYNIEEMFKPPHEPVSDGIESAPIGLEFSRVNVHNCTFILDLPDQAITAHRIQISDAQFSMKVEHHGERMTIGAKAVSVSRGEVLVNRQPGSPRARLNEEDGVLRFPVTALKLRQFSWMNDQVQVARLNVKLRGDQLTVKRFELHLDKPEIELGALLRFSTHDIARQLKPLGVELVQGPIDLELEGFGEIEAFNGRLQLVSPQIQIAGMTFNALSVDATKNDGGVITVQDLEVHYGEGRITGEGRYTLDREHGWADLWVEEFDWTTLPVEAPMQIQHAIAGKVRGHLHLRILDALQDKPRANFALDANLERAYPQRFGLGEHVDVTVTAEVEDDEITVNRFLLDGGGDRITIRGFYDLFTSETDITGAVSISGLSAVTKEFGTRITGGLNAKWRLDGPIENPRISSTVSGTGLGYDNLPKFDATGGVTVRDGILELDGLTLKSDAGEIGARGTVNLRDKAQAIDIRLDARKFDLSVLPFDLAGITGRLALDAQVGGTVETPQVEGQLRLMNPCWQPKNKPEPLCFRRLETRGAWSGDTFSIERLVLRDRRHALVDLRGTGRVSTKEFKGHLTIDEAPIALINQIISTPLPVRGLVSIDVETAGTLLAPRGEGTVTIRNAGYDRYELGHANLTVRGDTKTMRIRGDILDGMGLNVFIPTEGDNPVAEAMVRFERVRLEKWLPEVAAMPVKTALSGQVLGTFDLSTGAIQNIEVKLRDLQTAYRLDEAIEYVAAARETVEINFDGRVIKISQLDLGLTLTDGPTVTGRNPSFLRLAGDVTTQGALDLTYRGTVDFALLHPFLTTTFSEYEGALELDGRLTGYGADVRPFANIKLIEANLVPRSSVLGSQVNLIEPVTFQLQPTIGPPTFAADDKKPVTGIMDLRLKPSLTNEKKNLGRFMRDENEVDLTEFHIHFEAFVPLAYRVSLAADDMLLSIPRTLRATIDAPRLVFELWEHELEDMPPERRMRLSGDIRILRGEYTKDITGLQQINQNLRNSFSARAETRTVSLFERIPALKRLMLDLSLIGDGGFFVRNQIAVLNTNLEMRIDLDTVKGFIFPMPYDTEDEQLKISGNVLLLPDSTLTYARREFEVANGRIQFGGLNFVEADVKATRTFTLRTGTANSAASSSFDSGAGGVRLEEVVLSAKLTLPTLASEPQFDFQLTSNSGATPLDVAMLVLTGSYPEDLSGAATAQPATEVLLAPLLSLVERPLEDTLKVDLALTPDSQGALVIDANKVLSRRLRLYSRVLVGDDNESRPQQIGLEYQINNVTFGELSSEKTSSLVTTTGRLRLKLNLN
ncbi:MAG: translocation/assembly module TamB domain-containing protein [Myxococcota bacterium]|nr:translocation/assembly module TamB domain-containing protein [Myxococcota bacterium]